MIHAVTLKWMSLASCWLLLNLEHLLFVQVFWVHTTIPNYYQKQGAIHKCSVSFSLFVYEIQKVFGKYARTTKGGIQCGVCAPTLAIV